MADQTESDVVQYRISIKSEISVRIKSNIKLHMSRIKFTELSSCKVRRLT